VKLENQAGLRQILDEEQQKARRLQLEIETLKMSLERVSEQQASLKVMGEKAMDDVRSRQLVHSSHSGSLEDRVMSLEARLGKASATIKELQAKEEQEALRHNKALADATDAIAQVVSRVKQVEERVAPDMMR
jgi:Mg2+ and Co2+ transporter CorA